MNSSRSRSSRGSSKKTSPLAHAGRHAIIGYRHQEAYQTQVTPSFIMQRAQGDMRQRIQTMAHGEQQKHYQTHQPRLTPDGEKKPAELHRLLSEERPSDNNGISLSSRIKQEFQ